MQPLSTDYEIGLIFMRNAHKALRSSEYHQFQLAEQLRTSCGDLFLSNLEDDQRVWSSVIAEKAIRDEFHPKKLSGVSESIEAGRSRPNKTLRRFMRTFSQRLSV
jgi:hypothetical protein